jgi:hypothetical protein
MKSTEATVLDRKSGGAEGPAVRPGSRTKFSVPLVLQQNRHPEVAEGAAKVRGRIVPNFPPPNVTDLTVRRNIHCNTPIINNIRKR